MLTNILALLILILVVISIFLIFGILLFIIDKICFYQFWYMPGALKFFFDFKPTMLSSLPNNIYPPKAAMDILKTWLKVTGIAPSTFIRFLTVGEIDLDCITITGVSQNIIHFNVYDEPDKYVLRFVYDKDMLQNTKLIITRNQKIYCTAKTYNKKIIYLLEEYTSKDYCS